MTQTFTRCSTSLRTLAILSGLMLGSCQTNAGDILAAGALDSSPEKTLLPNGGYADPQVVAVAAKPGDRGQTLPLNEPPANLKRKPVPLAAAYSDIAEPPPEVAALQQQAMAGAAPPQDLGALQPTEVNAHKNSLFSAGRPQPTTAPVAAEPAAVTPQGVSPQAAANAAEPVTSLVPGNMPTLGVNAMSKSLFSPSAEQQQILPVVEQTPEPATGQPLTEPDTGPPVLHKLSDPRPKRKILALREPTTGDVSGVEAPTADMPERVQLTPDQLAAMGAVPETPEDGAAAPDSADTAAPKKKKWLPSLSDLLAGGGKTKGNTP